MGNDDSKTQTSNPNNQAKGIWYDYLAEIQSSQISDILPYYKIEISYLQKLFRTLDKTNTKSLELADLRNIPALAQHPFKQRFITLFQQELTKIKTKKISLQIFLHLLATFHINTQLEQKAKFLFRAYDWDRDFKLNHNDLLLTFRMLFKDKIICEKLVTQQMLKNMAGQALVKYGARGQIKLEQFIEFVQHDEIQEVVTFRFSKNFQ